MMDIAVLLKRSQRMNKKSETYEKNFKILEHITDSINKDEIGIDDLVDKTKEALEAARNCMDILKKQKGEFKKLETDFSQLLNEVVDDNPKKAAETSKEDPF